MKLTKEFMMAGVKYLKCKRVASDTMEYWGLKTGMDGVLAPARHIRWRSVDIITIYPYGEVIISLSGCSSRHIIILRRLEKFLKPLGFSFPMRQGRLWAHRNNERRILSHGTVVFQTHIEQPDMEA